MEYTYTFPTVLSDYSIYDEDAQYLSFSELPLQWDGDESPTSPARRICLRGTVEGGPRDGRRSYHHVKAWTCDISKEIPWIYVQEVEEDHWIRLQKPNKSYKYFSRSLMTVLHCLRYAKRKPDVSWDSLVQHLSTVCSDDLEEKVDVFPPATPLEDLVNHIDLIGKAIQMDKSLRNSKVLSFLLKKVRGMKSYAEKVEPNLHEFPLLVARKHEQPVQQEQRKSRELEELQLEKLKQILGELKLADPRFRVHFQQRIGVIVGWAVSLCCALVATMISMERLHAEHITLWVSSGLLFFSIMSSQLLLWVYNNAAKDPASKFPVRVTRILYYEATFAAPALLYLAVFTEDPARYFLTRVLWFLCVLSGLFFF